MDYKKEYVFTELPITHGEKKYIDFIHSRQTGKPQSHQDIKDDQMQEHHNWINKNINTDDVREILTNPERGESITMLEIPEENFLLKTNIVRGYTSDDKPYEVEIGDAGNIENFTDEQVPIIVNMLNILENQGIESLWSKLTPEMYELAMNHSILAYELEEFYLEGNNKYDIVINDDLNRTHGLMISVFGRDFE